MLDPPWSLRIQDEAPLTAGAMVRGEAWVLPDDGEPLQLARRRRRHPRAARTRTPSPTTRPPPPQVVIHPGQRCTTPDGDELAETMDLGVRTWGNSPDGADVMLTGTYQMDGEVSRRLLRRAARAARAARRRAGTPR